MKGKSLQLNSIQAARKIILICCFYFKRTQNEQYNFRYDSVKIYNGGDASSTLIDTFCGTSSSNKYPPNAPVISSGNQMYIQFMTDYSYVDKGFHLKHRPGKFLFDCSLFGTDLEGSNFDFFNYTL